MPLLALYRLATTVLTPLAGVALDWRARDGKEDPERLPERMGVAGLPRPKGRLVWLHGASLGETLALLPLIERFIRRGVDVLVTSGTVSSANVLRQRLPAGALHQYIPLDAPKFIDSFLDHWRPDIALFAESELWPNFIAALRARRTPLILVNARISQQSVERWRRWPGAAKRVFGAVDLCLAQNNENAARFLGLGAPRVRVGGNLKYDVSPPPADAGRLAEFNGAVGARPVFCAISTHAGEEEEAVLAAHAEAAKAIPALLTVIVPRHKERGGEIAALAAAMGLRAALRSQGAPPGRDVDVYVADTIGEVGLFLRAAGVAFMGKSLVPGGGQNPIEPAKLGCAILYGPHIENFSDVYEALAAAKGAARVTDAAQLARAVQYLLGEPSRMRKMGRAAMEAVDKLGGASRDILAAIEPYLAQLAAERR